jgi:hypothetical protein
MVMTLLFALVMMGLASADVLMDFAVTYDAKDIDHSWFQATGNVSSIMSCAKICSMEPKCQSVLFVSDHCDLYDVRPIMVGVNYGLPIIPGPYRVLLKKLSDVPVDTKFELYEAIAVK